MASTKFDANKKLAGDPVASEAAARAISETKRSKAEFQARYGKDWFREWVKATSCSVDHDLRLRSYNNAIYGTGVFGVSGDPASVVDELAGYELRCRNLYGDQYNELRIHSDKDSRVVKLLLDDAVQTGRWKELPEELHAEYHRLKGSQI